MKIEDVDITELSPMMQQYVEIKKEYEHELLFFRVGDFYELFFEDGLIASRELELTLTGKNAGLKERVPMCGVPYHSVKPYIERLIQKGFKVAICEQLEEAKNAKGMVRRGVIEVISKGTITSEELLNKHNNHYIAAITDYGYIYVMSYMDISTGSSYVTSILHSKEKLINEILNLGILEVVLENNEDFELINILKEQYNIEISIHQNSETEKFSHIYKNIDNDRHLKTIKNLISYLVDKELKDLSHCKEIETVYPDDYLEMDVHTIRNLELVETLRLKERTYSLIWLLDKTKTSMGSRKIKNWLIHPLKNQALIESRYDKVDILCNQFILKDKLRDCLYEVYDIERLSAKITCGGTNARDLLQLKNSLKVLPEIKEILQELEFDYELNTHQDIYELLERAIYETPPITLKEGYLIKDGFNDELSELKSIRSGGKSFLADFEAKVKESTGIKNVKVGYNKIFGYYIEVSKGQVQYVSENLNWERRQTLANCERYISPELKEKEALILNAEEKIVDLEYQLFIEIKEQIKEIVLKLKNTAEILSELDALASIAVCAEHYRLVRPKFNQDDFIDIKEGRHPVIEVVSKNAYINNDCIMDTSINTLLITGPNMSGKSTYMRQLAIIVIMAQAGFFVPAKSANLPVIDKIFTRIGASDDLVSGESTFMVEMKEAKNAICNATKNSLILFDELGRGTATYDGMSIAESILDYVSTKIKCKTLFSTHYHELTRLEQTNTAIKNVHVSAKEENDNIIFLHKIKSGAVDKSYGIHVAKLAGMPNSIITRATDILNYHETTNKDRYQEQDVMQIQMQFDDPKEDDLIKEKLDHIDPMRITPIEAMNLIFELKEIVDKKESDQ